LNYKDINLIFRRKNKMRILIAVIAYNEVKNIADCLSDLISNKNNYDIILVDNSSDDGTIDIAKKNGINTLIHASNIGGCYGTIFTYFKYAYLEKYDIVCQFDGDGQHIAEELHKIIEPIQKNEADYIIGSRFLDKVGFQSYFLRRLGIKLFAKLDSLIIGHKVTDVTSGFRAHGRKVIELFGKHYKHEIYDTNQLLLLSHFAGIKIVEVPVRMKERIHGESDFNILNSVTYPFKGIVNILGTLLQKKEIKKYNKYINGNKD